MAQDLGLLRESYGHLLLVAGRVAEANGPVDDTTNYDTEEGRIAWAIMANERSANLNRARADAARAVLCEVLGWAVSDDLTEADLVGTEKVLAAFIEGQEAQAANWQERAETFRRGESPERAKPTPRPNSRRTA